MSCAAACHVQVYSALHKKLGKMLSGPVLEHVLRTGQAQLLRKSLRNELNFSAKLDSNLLYSTLQVESFKRVH